MPRVASASFPRGLKSSTSATPFSTVAKNRGQEQLHESVALILSDLFHGPTRGEMRLTRQQSMTRAYEFARVRRLGTSIAGRLLVLSAVPLDDSEEASKFGIICTKKVGCAVVRNLLKRRVRELLRSHGEEYARGYHFVCVLRWRAAEAPYDALEKDWLKTSVRLVKALRKHSLNPVEPPTCA